MKTETEIQKRYNDAIEKIKEIQANGKEPTQWLLATMTTLAWALGKFETLTASA